MRLGTCIALELAVAAGAIAGVWIGVGQASRLAGDYLTAPEAAASTAGEPRLAAPPNGGAVWSAAVRPSAANGPTLGPANEPAALGLPRAHLDVARPAVIATVFPGADEDLLAPLGASPVSHAKLNRGGSSLSLRLDFASGGRAAFKPEQIHPQSDPRREIAAYRIDRLLELGHVAPATSVAISVPDLIAAAEPRARDVMAARLAEEAIAHDGVVRGELSWWIPEIRAVTIGSLAIDSEEGTAIWSEYLQVGAKVPADAQPMIAQIASCILFDLLIDNSDRWSGSNTMGSPDGTTLYFMDNTLSFSLFTLGHKSNLEALGKIGVFPRRLVERLRALTYDQVAAAVADDPRFGPLLDGAEIRALLARRDHLVEHIDRLVAQQGAAAVLALP